EISLYPNPFSEQIQLQYFGSNQNHVADIFIYDHTGKLVTQESVSLNNTLLPSISTSHLNNGIYLVKIFVNGQMYWFKQLKNCL
ncbi:MAG: T9SS type A sorting domain-containing protein, partial [bacterium]|nr:T9SS type A sorting domain-containing protein [bacterium]